MTRRIPIVSTVVVLAVVATMIGLGVWQLHRKQWKEALIARYLAAETMNSEVPWPSTPAEIPQALYRHSHFDCAEVTGMGAIAGRAADGRSGWAHIAHCNLLGGGQADVALGWSTDPAPPQWSGGEVGGFVAGSDRGVRLVAAPAQAGLAQLAPPDPRDLPNNHLSYAVQWFLFAMTALVIYVLALNKKWRAENPS
uniref:SURF1 family cytochrome oxidase biogenesis protein n=1 Tax=Altererythrobacter segetis TaxID=1104773 RepID=UPI001FAFFED4|nr:SURF1 family cytochrome oxidase biogenesis protein [Altererythrobacter segetis]